MFDIGLEAFDLGLEAFDIGSFEQLRDEFSPPATHDRNNGATTIRDYHPRTVWRHYHPRTVFLFPETVGSPKRQ